MPANTRRPQSAGRRSHSQRAGRKCAVAAVAAALLLAAATLLLRRGGAADSPGGNAVQEPLPPYGPEFYTPKQEQPWEHLERLPADQLSGWRKFAEERCAGAAPVAGLASGRLAGRLAGWLAGWPWLGAPLDRLPAAPCSWRGIQPTAPD